MSKEVRVAVPKLVIAILIAWLLSAEIDPLGVIISAALASILGIFSTIAVTGTRAPKQPAWLKTNLVFIS